MGRDQFELYIISRKLKNAKTLHRLEKVRTIQIMAHVCVCGLCLTLLQSLSLFTGLG